MYSNFKNDRNPNGTLRPLPTRSFLEPVEEDTGYNLKVNDPNYVHHLDGRISARSFKHNVRSVPCESREAALHDLKFTLALDGLKL